ncbi:MAG: thioredoxin domain-containing protein [Sphingobacteriaceae bacterium]|nr:thioredoxin domain-containing protein [Sphingobacteriaceae bacterium]
MSEIPNSLIHESSPYLLQHAYNPVHWLPYSEKALAKAKFENKLILFSIGYSACHWCHVMEKESFEDREIADIMNANFVCIKVDREERSDIDMLYMGAVQLMTGHGGWPLNCFTLPNGKPVYGGTYFNKKEWKNILMQLEQVYRKEASKMEEYAEKLSAGMKQAELLNTSKNENVVLSREELNALIRKWQSGFDLEYGGDNRAPKFPMPGNYQFLLNYAIITKNDEVLKHVKQTLQHMSDGGIYDQLRGGFARYSVDKYWKVPHFEKMLYDNAQLISLYLEAYCQTGNEQFKNVAEQTLLFIEDEWMGKEGCVYSAYDADSEGEEGKYYVWTKEELKQHLKDDFDLFAELYSVNEVGYWEDGNYILMRNPKRNELALKHGISIDELIQIDNRCRGILLVLAQKRPKPLLDDKTITAWNALACSAFCKAFLMSGKEKYKKTAIDIISFILKQMYREDGGLWRIYKNGNCKVNAMLDDYAFVISALMDVYVISSNRDYLIKAEQLVSFTLKEFNNPESSLLFYADSKGDLMLRTTEISDNVIPSSNSQMALNLFKMGKYFGISVYIERANSMLAHVMEEAKRYPPGYSNWLQLALFELYPFFEIAIVGKHVDEMIQEVSKQGITNAILATARGEESLPLVKNRYVSGKTLIYVCKNNTCDLPLEKATDVKKRIEDHIK